MKDPYHLLPASDKYRTSFTSSSAAINQIRRCGGELSITLNVLIDKLHQHLLNHGLTQYDPERFYACLDSFGRGLAPQPGHQSEEASSRDDGRGTQPVARVAEKAVGVTADASRPARSKASKGKGKSSGKRKEKV